MCKHILGWSCFKCKNTYNWIVHIIRMVKAVRCGTIWHGNNNGFFRKRASKIYVICMAGY